MKYKPHDYQRFATEFICEHREAALFLQMGLGKTIITLTAIDELLNDYFSVEKVLIVAPLRVARDTWPQEIEKWDHLKDLSYEVLVGTAKQRREALKRPADICIINRETIPWLVDEVGKNWPFDMVVIDELSSFKNHKAKRFKKLLKVRPFVNRVVGLTGTPSSNGLLDLWAQFRLLDGGKRLGKFIGHYRERFFRPGRRNGYQVYEWIIMPGSEEKIYDLIGDITISMETADYLTLPEVTDTTHEVTMQPKEKALYDKLKRDMVIQVGDTVIDAGNAGVLSGKLMQMASGAIYTYDEVTGEKTGWEPIHSAKIDALGDIIEAANGQSVLVSYWFQHERDRIIATYPEARSLESSEDFTAWNEGKIPLGLIQPQSAGHGLNLQAGGHILVWVTTPWSLELVQQTNARLNRQGQAHPVSIIHLVTKGTIDVNVLHALQKKDSTQSALIGAVKAQLTETLKRKEAA